MLAHLGSLTKPMVPHPAGQDPRGPGGNSLCADTDRRVWRDDRHNSAHTEWVSVAAGRLPGHAARYSGHHDDVAQPKDLTDDKIVELYFAWCEAEEAQVSDTPLAWAWEAMADLTDDNPERAWALLLRVIALARVPDSSTGSNRRLAAIRSSDERSLASGRRRTPFAHALTPSWRSWTSPASDRSVEPPAGGHRSGGSADGGANGPLLPT